MTDGESMPLFGSHFESAMIHSLLGNEIYRVYDAGFAGVLHFGLLYKSKWTAPANINGRPNFIDQRIK